MRLFLRWCEDNDHPPVLDRALVRSWVTDLLDGGAAPATARSRQMSLKRYSAWLLEEDETDTDPIRDLKPPKLDTKVVHGLTDEQCAALVGACQGKEFVDRRDEAVARLLIETGMRAGEVLGLMVADVDIARGLAVIRRGKGGKGRVVPFGPQVSRSIDRYLRTRRSHPRAGSAVLWLGGGGQAFAYHDLNVAMKRRAAAAGIAGFHLHLLRNTAATRWLAAGGSENGLWPSPGGPVARCSTATPVPVPRIAPPQVARYVRELSTHSRADGSFRSGIPCSTRCLGKRRQALVW